MRLKTLQLHGFKTFAERTEIAFSEGVTAVVGPNGSGKSNLGDAILWVLGEQKASALRGSKAQDVIFAGTDRRKATGLAEVSLTVDNSDGTLPIGFAEVTITRRAYRTGEGEFFLNKVPCRLKDIYELFLDTGVGRNSYSLVGQSQIDAVLSADPAERRGLFEEAAGIKKYRVKKRDALRKLEATDANVHRVSDILADMDERMEPLRLQAERAEKFHALRSRLRAIETNLLVTDLRFADFELTTVRHSREAEAEALGKHAARLTTAELKAQSIAQNLADAEAQWETCRLNHQVALSAAERAAAQFALAQQRGEGLQASLRLLEQEREELASREDQLRRRLAETEAELADARQSEAPCAAVVADLQAKGGELNARLAELTRQSDRRRAETVALARQQAARQSEAARMEARAAELAAHLPVLQADVERFAQTANEAARDGEELAAAGEDARAALEKAAAHLAEAVAARDTASRNFHDAQQSAEEARGNLLALSTRLRALQELDDAQEGYFAGVKAVFEAARHHALPQNFTVVADALQVPSGYELAFETALAASVQDIIADTEADAKAAIAYLYEHRLGRATFLPLDRMRPVRETLDLGRQRGNGVRGPALDIAAFDERFRPALDVLLGRVVVCETLDDALRAAQAARGWNRIVTLTGEIVLPTGALSGGRQQGRTANLLGRKTEIATLREDGRAQDATVSEAQAALADARRALETADTAVNEAQAARQSAQAAVTETARRAEHAAAELRRAQDAHAQAVRRTETAQQALVQARADATHALSLLATGDAQTADADDLQASETAAFHAFAAARDGVQGDLTTARIALATTAEAVSNLSRALRTVQLEFAGVAEQSLRKARQQQSAQDEYERLVAQAAARDAESVRAAAALQDAQAALDAQAQARQLLLQQSYEASAALRVLNEARAGALDAIHKHEVREARLSAQHEQLALRLLNEYDMTAAEALALPEDPEITSGTPQEVARLRRDLRAMGEVNTGALEEWEQTRARHEFLTAQKDDLDQARAKLLAAIKEIDEATRDVFLETFRAVGDAFSRLFARLFGGGTTELALTDPADLLETGIDVFAQPPGKKRQSLSLLSGGERALTAAALLFAFLEVKPSPFCVLDEVDAPLDGANVERFADLLREFGTRSQMIIITHNATTMEAAPLWYGVTMPEPGVSRVLSLQVPQTASA